MYPESHIYLHRKPQTMQTFHDLGGRAMSKVTSTLFAIFCLFACSVPETNLDLSACINACNKTWRACSDAEAIGKADCEQNAGDAIKGKACGNYYHPRFRAMTCDTDQAHCREKCESRW